MKLKDLIQNIYTQSKLSNRVSIERLEASEFLFCIFSNRAAYKLKFDLGSSSLEYVCS